MATSLVHVRETTRGHSFIPKNGITAQHQVEAQIVRARQEQEEREERFQKRNRTKRGRGAP